MDVQKHTPDAPVWITRDATADRDRRLSQREQVIEIIKGLRAKQPEDFLKAIEDPENPVAKAIDSIAQHHGERAAAEAVHAFAEKHATGGGVSGGSLLEVFNRDISGRTTEAETAAHLGSPITTREQRELLDRAKRDPKLMAELRKERVGFIERSITADNTSIAGAPTAALNAYTGMYVENSFAGVVDEQTIGTGDAKIAIVGQVTLADEDSDNQSRTEAGGALTEVTVSLKTGVAQNSASLAAANDIPGLQSAVATAAMRGYGRWIALKNFAAIKTSAASSTAGTITEVATGVAAGLPATAGALVTKLAEMVAAVPSGYRPNCSFQLSRAVEQLLFGATSGTGGDFAFDQTMKLRMFRGYPIRVADAFEDGNAADECSASFGDHFSGVVQVNGSPMIIARAMYEVQPGRVTFFTSMRGQGVVRDGRAMSALITGT